MTSHGKQPPTGGDKSPGKAPRTAQPRPRDTDVDTPADESIEGSAQQSGFGKGGKVGNPRSGVSDEPRGHAHSGSRD